ncbi:hypothetical protein IJU97_05290 [bacterium]|nr:hypothetical protein [bacterium]
MNEGYEFVELNDEEIIGKGTYNGVVLEVKAPIGSFPKGTELKIKNPRQDRTIKDKEAQLIEQIEEINEETPMVSFDISFIDPVSGKELQPLNDKVVEVVFNYEGNGDLKEADVTSLKVYHLEDKDEDGNDLDVVDVKEVKDIEITDGELVVSAESFSTYTVVL